MTFRPQVEVLGDRVCLSAGTLTAANQTESPTAREIEVISYSRGVSPGGADGGTLIPVEVKHNV